MTNLADIPPEIILMNRMNGLARVYAGFMRQASQTPQPETDPRLQTMATLYWSLAARVYDDFLDRGLPRQRWNELAEKSGMNELMRKASQAATRTGYRALMNAAPG